MSKSPETGSAHQTSSQTPNSESSKGADSLNVMPGSSVLPVGTPIDSKLTKIMDGMANVWRGRDGLVVGECFQGKYEIVRLLGAGGMGQVYQARHVELGTMVAIKVLNRNFIQDEQAIERFKQEARASARIVHPNAVRVFD